MSFTNSNPIEELKILDEQVEKANELNALRPIFYRVNEIASQHLDNFAVQLAAGDVKQHLVRHGTMLKESKMSSPVPPVDPVLAHGQPAPPPDWETGMAPTVALPNPFRPSGAPLPAPETQPQPQPAQPQPPVKSNRGAWVAAAVAALIGVAGAVLLYVALKSRASRYTAEVAVQIGTVPQGATVRVNGQAKCTSNCRLSLRAGNYEIAAILDGYEAAARRVTVAAGRPSAVNLTLEPQSQTVRIVTDLPRGKIAFDGQPRADLQLGRFLFEKVPPGLHTVQVTGPKGEASFSFELANGRPPSITGTVLTRNFLVVLIASIATQARVVTSSGPWKLAVNGQPENEAGPAGVGLKNFHPGVDEFVIGQGNERHSVKESFGAAPTLTAFLITDVNAGTLIVATGENDVRVFVNGREYLSRRGPLRIQTIGPVVVRVSKQGFVDPPVQTAEVKKGAATRLAFSMKPLR